MRIISLTFYKLQRKRLRHEQTLIYYVGVEQLWAWRSTIVRSIPITENNPSAGRLGLAY